MWQLEERRVHADFDALTCTEAAALRAEEEKAGLAVVRMYRTEYARWEDPDAAEPDKLGTLAVVWEVTECSCDDEECSDGFATVAEALDEVLGDWDVYTTSDWEPSSWPWDPADDTLWVSATETYEYERSRRYKYSLHVSGVTPEIRAELFAAVGVKREG